MFTPIFHIRAIADVYVAKRSMSIITGTTQHRILAIDLLREKYTITIERQESIFALEKLLKVKSIGNTNRRAMITITPSHPITVFNPCNTRVVFIFRLNHFRVTCFKLNRFMIDIPMNSVLTKTCKDIHLYSFVITTEYACKTILKRNNSTIENTIR